ncbi:hypothetical protein LJC08_05370 [Methanimicrococcus sp. OttesenSCG-928-J09]|nr:hypothetical protein [Methanimicrococcus sp. OttesenSCG-928-J09]
MASDKKRKWFQENPTSSNREFWKQFKEELKSLFSSFRSIDPDLENYIVSGKFIDYERNHYCRNYFVLSASVLFCDGCSSENSDCSKCCAVLLKDGRHKILGYFTLAGKTIDLTNLSLSKKLSRISRTSARKMKYVESYLIGHLSKNYFNHYDREILGYDIFLRAFRLIQNSHKAIGINVIRIDCKNNKEVIRFYQNNGFEIIFPSHRIQNVKSLPFKNNENNENNELITMIRSVQ